MAVTFGLISKMIQMIRFINIDYPYNLRNILTTWGTDIFSISIPQQIDEQIVSRDINAVFTKYSVDPSFLSNFWGVFIILIGMATLWALCRGLLYCLEQCWKSKNTLIHRILHQLSIATLNFLIVSLYGGFGDIVFFTVLEMKSVEFGSAWSYFSFVLCIFFILLGVCLMCIHWNFLLKYRKLRLQSSASSDQALEELIKKHEAIAVLYEDFSDASLFKHGFLFVGVARDTLISLIITTMPHLPLFQSVLLVCCSIFICIYLLFNNPFRHRFELASQVFVEMGVFIVYISVITLASLDSYHTSAFDDRVRLGSVIIVINIIMNSGCAFLMLAKLSQQIWSAYKNRSQNKRLKVHAANSVPNLCTTQVGLDRSRVDNTERLPVFGEDFSSSIKDHIESNKGLVLERDGSVPLQTGGLTSSGHSELEENTHSIQRPHANRELGDVLNHRDGLEQYKKPKIRRIRYKENDNSSIPK